MRIALTELRRRPRRFVTVGGALTVLVVLLVVLGGFLDGLERSQTGAYRAHEGRVLVLSDDAELQLGRSQVPTARADEVRAVDGVGDVGTLASVTTTIGDEDGGLADVVVYGYDLATDVLPAPPDRDGAVVDAALGDLIGVEEGDVLTIGPARSPVTVAAVVDDVSQGAPTVWLQSGVWRDVVGEAVPQAVPPPDVTQALVVAPTDGSDLDELEAAVDDLGGLTAGRPAELIGALDVVQQQSASFTGIIAVTFVVTLLVSTLFFVLITIERTRLYAVLKALGARSRDLLVGICAQAVVITAVALLVGGVISVVFISLLPPDLPLRVLPTRLGQIALGTLATAVVGSLLTLRRILRIDPASAIG
jgi:putative ABC transport system permease protein